MHRTGRDTGRGGRIGVKLPEDVKELARGLAAGYDARCARWHETGLEFDRRALEAVEQAALGIGAELGFMEEAREQLQKKILLSTRDGVAYEYLGETFCGRRTFYAERSRFYERVAREMGMI